MDPQDAASTMTLGPHCQCCGAEEHLRAYPGHARRGPRMSRVTLRGRTVFVPWWVSASQASSVRARADERSLLDVRPRYQQRPRGLVGPAGVRSTNMFRKHLRATTSSRCQVSHGVYDVHSQMDDSLRSIDCFLEALHEEIAGILGSVGTNEGMSKLLHAIGTCWDWHTLIHHRSSASRVALNGGIGRAVHAVSTACSASSRGWRGLAPWRLAPWRRACPYGQVLGDRERLSSDACVALQCSPGLDVAGDRKSVV
jgi:hypothetical protein